MEFIEVLGQIINGPKAAVLSGLTYGIVAKLKRPFGLRGAAVQWFALGVAATLCAIELFFRDGPPLAGKPLVKEIVTLAATAIGAVFVFGKDWEAAGQALGVTAPDKAKKQETTEEAPAASESDQPGLEVSFPLPDKFKDSPIVKALTAPEHEDKEKPNGQ